MSETSRTTITNGSDTDTLQASIVSTQDDPTEKGIVVCNADGSSI